MDKSAQYNVSKRNLIILIDKIEIEIVKSNKYFKIIIGCELNLRNLLKCVLCRCVRLPARFCLRAFDESALYTLCQGLREIEGVIKGNFNLIAIVGQL